MKKKKVVISPLSFEKISILALTGQTAISGGQNSVQEVCQPPTTTVDGTYVNTNKTCWPTCKAC